ncbi:MAG: DUF885 domain-containing protein [Verrucomicrobiota bacterium]
MLIRCYCLLLIGFALGANATEYEQACERLATSSAPDTSRLNELFRLDWEHSMQDNPEFATQVGYPGQNGRWTDNSLDAIERRKHETLATFKVLQSIRADRLDPAAQLNYDLFLFNVTNAIAGARFPGEFMPISQLGGVQQDAAQMLELAPHAKASDYEDLLSRLNGLPVVVDQTLILLQNGLKRGVTPPRVTLRDVPQQVEAQMVPDPDRNPLLKSFREFPPGISAVDQARLRSEAAGVLEDKVIPAFARLRDYLTNTYIPGARVSIGMSALPDGPAWYAFAAESSTTTSLTPQQIHEIGLAEVKRIRAEMEPLIRQAGFGTNFAAFARFMRTNTSFYYTNKQDLLRDYRDIAKRIDPELIRFFGKLPRLPYGVMAIPAYSEKSQTTAYYQPGSYTAGRPGYFCANTYALDTRPRWEMEALTSHEAVPGHHLQISLALEMENVPEFRKHGSYTAFVEGWGLYAESLSGEMGLYREPEMKYGQLTYELWRAIRLVVDTGIHSMGWTRQQAIDYFLANSAKSEHDVTVEVDRYIVWPGQALAYKIGEMKFKELRSYAERELGPKFDIRTFHDECLDSGALPLAVLDARVREWVKNQKAGLNRE